MGYSEQAYHKWERHRVEQETKNAYIALLVRREIEEIREKMPRIGGEKLWIMTAEKLAKEGLTIGRDKFIDLYAEMGFIIKKHKKRKKTTDSSQWQRQYEDLRKALIPSRPEELVVADITFIDTEAGDAYGSLITDAYSKMVLGYEVSDRMRAQDCLVALNMAIKNRQYKGICIHHSDRGSQYNSKGAT